MKKLLMMMTIVAASAFAAAFAHADSVGLNYSAIQKNGSGTVDKGTWELIGTKAIGETTDLTVKGSLVNAHATPGYGTGLEVGVREKYALFDNVGVWVQPAVALHSPETGGSYAGYVVDAGVDIKHAALTFIPAVSYANDFGDARTVRQSTVGMKVSYAVTNHWAVDGRFRHEYNEVGQDANRLYGGVTYKF